MYVGEGGGWNVNIPYVYERLHIRYLFLFVVNNITIERRRTIELMNATGFEPKHLIRKRTLNHLTILAKV